MLEVNFNWEIHGGITNKTGMKYVLLKTVMLL